MGRRMVMASVNLSKQTTLFTPGQGVDKLYLIVSGSVQIQCQGIAYSLEKGDVIGLLESCSETHFCTCVTQKDCVLLPIPYSHKEGIVPIISGNRDMTNLFSISLFRQILYFFEAYNEALEANRNYRDYITDAYETYQLFCSKHAYTPQRLATVEQLPALVFSRPIENWEYSYYIGLRDIFGHQANDIMVSNPNVLNGFTLKAFFDIRRVISCYREIHQSDVALSSLFVNEDRKDLLACYSSLLYHTSVDDPDYDIIRESREQLIRTAMEHHGTNRALLSERIAESDQKMEYLQGSDTSGELSGLHNSALTILDFTDCGEPLSGLFLSALDAYKKLPDKNGADDESRHARRELTKYFYQVYAKAFLRSLTTREIPVVVKMFFNFGYVDEELAGLDNATTLYTICDHLPTDPACGVYSMQEWLMAILDGQKAPSRNEFDQDYPTYVRDQKAQGYFSAEEADEMLTDPEQMVLFEINNLFPLVNKMTYGRITTFCPVFARDNVVKPLDSCLLDAASILDALDKIRAIDFSAFYRQTVFSDPNAGINREFIQVEVLPDIILTPNVGSRPVMWQEIEGKKRTTPARMMLSIFFTEDLFSKLARIVGEYRWEMCRRIQGARWNDLSERSLTSEYFDYIQFYRKNHELSVEAKEKIKNSLQKARNSYKELFVQDYCAWIQYESNGSPRLNKTARSILFTYCPFSLTYRRALHSNPLYTELFDRYDIRMNTHIHKLENIFTKLNNQIPDELISYMDFLKM